MRIKINNMLMLAMREKYLYNVEKSAGAGARYIIMILIEISKK